MNRRSSGFQSASAGSDRDRRANARDGLPVLPEHDERRHGRHAGRRKVKVLETSRSCFSAAKRRFTQTATGNKIDE